MTESELERYESILKVLFRLEDEMTAIKLRLNELDERDNA